MKTYLTYGAAMAVAGLLFTLLMFFAGFHDSAEKMGSTVAQILGNCAPLAIGITGLVLGIRARRAEVPATERFGYGQALGAGLMIGVFSTLFGMITSVLYFSVINSNFTEVLYQMQVSKMELKGMSAAQIEQAEPMIRKFMTPPVMAAFGAFFSFFGSLIISLIAAAFLKRPEAEMPPSL